MEYPKEEEAEAVSPMGQYFNSSVLCIYIIGVLELEIPFDDSQALPLLTTVFLPINPRFSSIMVHDKNGGKRWKKVEVNLKEHINIPIFTENTSSESYDNSFNVYLSRIAMEELPQNRPLWEVHIFNYPTSNAASTLIFKLHHALGDGYSLMGALLSCLKRADDPSLPLSFPSLKPSQLGSSSKGFFKKCSWVLSSAFNTLADFGYNILKSSIIGDEKTPIRSGEGVQSHPISISTLTFSIDHIKDIKNRLGVVRYIFILFNRP